MLGFRKFRVKEASMEPTLSPGDVILTERLTYLFRRPRLGEIVVARNDGIIQVKRVVDERGRKYLLLGDNTSYSSSFLVRRREILGKCLGL